jgi:hypothetical protein
MNVILISGDRHWGESDRDTVLFENAMRKWVEAHGVPALIIEGCARGADRMAEQWAQRNGVYVWHHPALWDLEGKSAGPRRNIRMLERGPHSVIAFHRDLARSKGTRHMVEIAVKAGIPTWIPVAQPQLTLGLVPDGTPSRGA